MGPDPSERLRSLPSEQWAELERVLRDFESAWQRGEPPSVAEYARRAAPVSGPTLLAELAHLDLEYRLKAGLPASAASYLERFPNSPATAPRPPG